MRASHLAAILENEPTTEIAMRKIIALVAILTFGQAFAATAYFTGNMNMVTTVTYQMGYNCEYNYAGKTFWMVFPSFCPASVEVQ